jgi:transposase
MPRERTSMKTYREILRLALNLKLSAREISNITGASRGTVQDCLRRAKAVGLDWPLPENFDDIELTEMMYPALPKAPSGFAEPDFSLVQKEMQKKGVTLTLLWEEYAAEHPSDFYSYSQFVRRYRNWCQTKEVSMRQVHRAGDKLFLDFSGMTIPLTCRETGEVTAAQIFVACHGVSNYTYVEACTSQNLFNWLAVHVRAFNFFGGVPQFLVPDNLKSAVVKAKRFDPLINRSYQRLAEHYGTSIVPARAYKPKDKAKVEKGVQVVQHWILARIRNLTFFTIADLNKSLWVLLKELNEEPFQKLPGSRRSTFEEIDQPALMPLPTKQFEFEEWVSDIKIAKDYHVEVQGHYYSVPFKFVGERVDIRCTDSTLEVFRANVRIASHIRNWAQGGTTTAPEHMPPSHAEYHGMTPERFLSWARDIGPATTHVVRIVLASKKQPQLSFGACFGILKAQVSAHGADDVELACKHAITVGCISYAFVKSVLEHGVEKLLLQQQINLADIEHTNIRGPANYN